MLTLDEARAIAIKNLPKLNDSRIDLIILDECTIAKSYGWVFFFNSKQFMETRDANFAIGGNGPVVVRHNGKCDRLTSAGVPEETIATFEKKHWLKP